MSTFSYTPDFSAKKSTKPMVNSIVFNGYEQRQAFGINTMADVWSLTFAIRENSEADEIEAFLRARGGVESFSWTPPYASDPLTFVCRSWDRVAEKATRSSITATFEQVFDLL